MSEEVRKRQRRAGERITWIGALANLLLIGVKLAAGLLGRSQALIADAIHSVSDLFSDVVVLFGLRYGRKGPDDEHHFGHARIETMAAAIVGVSLLGAAVYLGYGAASDIFDHSTSRPTWLAVVGAVVSLAVKEALYRYTVIVGKRIKSPAVIANAWHHRSDAFSSVAVLIGVLGAQLHPDLRILDAVAALVVSFFILKVGIDVLREASRELVDTAPPSEVMDEILTRARAIPKVIDIHDVKVRSVGGTYKMQVHIVVDGDMTVREGHRIARQVSHSLKREIEELDDVVVHVDPEGDEGNE